MLQYGFAVWTEHSQVEICSRLFVLGETRFMNETVT